MNRDRAPARSRLCCATLLTVALAACSTSGTGSARKPGAASNSPGSGVSVPGHPGPVARPAPADATASSKFAVAVKPLGIIAYDGLSQPLTSPNGEYIAVQQGSSPTWPTVLAAREATVPQASVVGVYRVSAASLAPEDCTALPAGLLVGRSADNKGFLVEAPQADGSRWIGRVSWKDRELTWLVQGEMVNAHATLTADDGLLWTRRTPASMQADLCYLPPGVAPGTEPFVLAAGRESFAYPLAAARPEDGAVFAVSPSGIELVPVRLARSSPPRLGPRRWLSPNPDPLGAHQAAAGAQTPLHAAADAADKVVADPVVAIFNPQASTMALVALRDGRLATFPPRCIAAAPRSRNQWLASGAKNVVMAEPTFGGNPRPEANVVAGPAIPRAVAGDSGGEYLLFGPTASQADGAFEFQVIRMQFQRESTQDGTDTTANR